MTSEMCPKTHLASIFPYKIPPSISIMPVFQLAYVTRRLSFTQPIACNCTNYSVFTIPEDESGTPISPLHDIPLYANAEKTAFNMVVEIPRWTNAKMEVGSYSWKRVYVHR